MIRSDLVKGEAKFKENVLARNMLLSNIAFKCRSTEIYLNHYFYISALP